MRAQPGRPVVGFPAFCDAVQLWLRDAVCLDPSLAAVADLVHSARCSEDELRDVVASATDTHGVLGASALLSLWSGLPR